MNTCILFLFFVFLFILVKTNKVPIKSDNFGPYDVIYKGCEICKGPKVKNAAEFSINNTGTHNNKIFNLFFPTKGTIDEIKIALYSVTANGKKKLYSYRLNHPCTHYFAAALIKTFFNSSDCVIEKGSYHFLIRPEDTTSTVLGPKFFYGDYLFKSVVLSKQGNIMCLFSEHEVVKKT